MSKLLSFPAVTKDGRPRRSVRRVFCGKKFYLDVKSARGAAGGAKIKALCEDIQLLGGVRNISIWWLVW